MFIVKNTKRIGEKVYRTVLLRKSYREGKKVKKQTIANLSNCSEEEVNAISFALKNKGLLSQNQDFKIV
jgi:predicted type IV restriction endonuclease